MKKLFFGVCIVAAAGVSSLKAAEMFNHRSAVEIADGRDDGSKKKKKSSETKSTRSCCSKTKSTSCTTTETKVQ